MSVGSPSFGSDHWYFWRIPSRWTWAAALCPCTGGRQSGDEWWPLNEGCGEERPSARLGWPEGHQKLLRNQPWSLWSCAEHSLHCFAEQDLEPSTCVKRPVNVQRSNCEFATDSNLGMFYRSVAAQNKWQNKSLVSDGSDVTVKMLFLSSRPFIFYYVTWPNHLKIH